MEKVSIVSKYNLLGLSKKQCMSIAGISRSEYYYKPKEGKAGKRATQTTSWQNHETQQLEIHTNEKVVEQICAIKADSNQGDYYKLICLGLCLKGYYINHKKVYRLMKEHGLLVKALRRTGKKYVKHRRVAPTRPLELIEMDIKYIYIVGTRKYAYVLTLIDTFTRYVLSYSVGYSMKTAQVKQVWEFVIATYFQGVLTPNCELDIEVRNDNGKQFSSEEIQAFFKDNYLMQVFTHPYTPEENGHIESFHKTLGKAIDKDTFTILKHAEDRLETFYQVYNNERTHGSIKVPPAIFWALFDQDKIDVKIIEKRKSVYKLKVAYQEILTLPNIKKYQYWVIRA